MAVGTLFSDNCVFIDKGALVLHMTASAERFGRHSFEAIAVKRVVRIVAIGTGHLVLRNRMMGKLGKLHLDLHVAAGTELFLFVTADFLLRPLMQLVAIKAADVIKCVSTGIPVSQVLCRCRRVAFQAEH